MKEKRDMICRKSSFILIILLLAITQNTNGAYEDKTGAELEQDIRNSNTKVHLENAYIKGDIDLSRQDINCEIYIKNSIFDGNVTFEDSNFKKRATVIRTKFNKVANFRNSLFQKAAFFKGFKFEDLADFWHANFTDSASFLDVSFLKDANFMLTSFNRDAHFINCLFNGSARFDNAQFGNTFYCHSSIFKNISEFYYSKFNNGCSFSNTCFQKSNFEGAEFNGKENIDFKDTIFSDSASFLYAKFAGNINFSKSSFKREANFEKSISSDQMDFTEANLENNLVLNNTKINIIKLLNIKLARNSSLNLVDSEYKKMYVRWSSIKDHIINHDLTYLTLEKNLRDTGQFGDANACYYQYRELKRMNNDGIGKVQDSIVKYFSGYGVKSINIIITMIIVAGFFGLYFSAKIALSEQKITESSESNPLLDNPSDMVVFSTVIGSILLSGLAACFFDNIWILISYLIISYLVIYIYIIISFDNDGKKALFMDYLFDPLVQSLLIILEVPDQLHSQAERELKKILIDKYKCKLAVNLERLMGWSLLGLLVFALSNSTRQGLIAGI